MSNTKWLVWICLFRAVVGLYSCKQKRHNRSGPEKQRSASGYGFCEGSGAPHAPV